MVGAVTDDWAFRFPGIADVEHVYFCTATSAAPELVQQYFQQAYQLGRDFERPPRAPGTSPRLPDHPRARSRPAGEERKPGGQASMPTG